MDELFTSLLNSSIKKGVSDIHITVGSDCKIYKREYGELKLLRVLEETQGKKLVNYLRFISNIDINYLSKPQTGNYQYLYKDKIYYLRISSLPGKDLDSVVIRILNTFQGITSIEKLTPLKETVSFLRSIVDKKWGLFIISGPTGSGKSTTLYTLLEEINKITNKSIVTLEDPIEIHKSFGLQIQINERQGITYESSLRQILRHDPDIIMIGEIRDKETAKLAVTCALTGHLVLTTIHSGSAISTIKRLLNLGISEIDIIDILLGVLCQEMLYNNNQPIVNSEFIDRNNIISYLNNENIRFKSFSENYNHLKSTGILK